MFEKHKLHPPALYNLLNLDFHINTDTSPSPSPATVFLCWMEARFFIFFLLLFESGLPFKFREQIHPFFRVQAWRNLLH